MHEPRSLTIVFRPGMLPADRHVIEDELEERLGELGETTGGGTAVDLSECDIGLDVADIAVGMRIIREVLMRLEVPLSTPSAHALQSARQCPRSESSVFVQRCREGRLDAPAALLWDCATFQ